MIYVLHHGARINILLKLEEMRMLPYVSVLMCLNYIYEALKAILVIMGIFCCMKYLRGRD